MLDKFDEVSKNMESTLEDQIFSLKGEISKYHADNVDKFYDLKVLNKT